MNRTHDATLIATKKPGIARSAMACTLLALVFGCGDPCVPGSFCLTGCCTEFVE
jgi:hypothetical protein